MEKAKSVKLVLISDTHGRHDDFEIPGGDILVHAGDVTRWGEWESLEEFSNFLKSQPHPFKIVVAGNHDFCFQKDRERAKRILEGAIYLEDESVEIKGIKFYGSPWQPHFGGMAFNLPRGEAFREKWNSIPRDTDVLVTHGPPFGIGDRVRRGESVGCKELEKTVEEIKPSLHVFGHIHEDSGHFWRGKTLFVNASLAGSREEEIGSPVVLKEVLSQEGRRWKVE